MTEITQPARSRILFLSLVRLIVEKYGGHLDIDMEKDTFTVNIPQDRKSDCFQELTEAVGPLNQVHESLVPVQ
jgi:hypothetical protein